MFYCFTSVGSDEVVFSHCSLVAKHLYIDTLSLCTTHVGGLSYTVWIQLQFTCTTTKNKYLQLTLSELYFTNKIEQKIIFEIHVKMEPQF